MKYRVLATWFTDGLAGVPGSVGRYYQGYIGTVEADSEEEAEKKHLRDTWLVYPGVDPTVSASLLPEPK